MAAYEYTTEPGSDLSKYTEFVKDLAEALIALGAQEVFALTALPLHTEILTEIEMIRFLSTILINEKESGVFSSTVAGPFTTTDWVAVSSCNAS